MAARFLTWAHEVELHAHPGVARSTQRLVLLMLTNYANADGEAWPAVVTMAEVGYLSSSTVREALNALHGDGVIGTVGRRSGGRVPTRWRLQPTDRRSVEDDEGTTQPTDQRRVTHRPSVPNPPIYPSNPPTIGDDPLEPADIPQRTRKVARTPDATTSTGAPLTSRRQGDGPRSARKRSSANDDVRQRADAVVRAWWERQEPRPTQPFPAVLQVCERALRNGWIDAELATALNDAPAVSGASLDYWRNKRSNGARRPTTPAERVAEVQAVANEQLRMITGGRRR